MPLELVQAETHGGPNCKQKGGEYQIRGGKAMPRCVLEGVVGMGPTARRIDNDHEGDGHASEDV